MSDDVVAFRNADEIDASDKIVDVSADGNVTVYKHEPEHVARIALIAYQLHQKVARYEAEAKKLKEMLDALDQSDANNK